jgi:hypothetical protein
VRRVRSDDRPSPASQHSRHFRNRVRGLLDGQVLQNVRAQDQVELRIIEWESID